MSTASSGREALTLFIILSNENRPDKGGWREKGNDQVKREHLF